MVNLESRPAVRRTLALPAILVFFGGVNLILVQWVLVRELTTLLLGTELVVLLVSVAYFVGLSVGYQLAGRIRRSWLPALGVITLVLHLSLPIWFRLLVAWFDSIRAYGLAFIVLPLLTPFVVSAFYSIFLPLLVDNGEGSLPGLYALELLGSAGGVLALVLLGGLGMQAVFVLYSVGLLISLFALGMRLRWIIPLAFISGLWLTVLPGLNDWSNALWYQQIHNLPARTTTLFSGYSAYQKVDVLESPNGTRYLFLDGLQHFGSADGSRLNVVMGQVPASLTKPGKTLVLGAGTMEMAAMIADHAGHVTTVEIDPIVVSASTRYFLKYNRMDTLTNRAVIFDDAKYYIANTDSRYDLIATDLPAAFAIQTAALYAAPFYQTVAQRLMPRGVLVANLTSTFAATDDVSRRIAASLLTAFRQVIVVTSPSAGWSFAYAGNDLPFSRVQLEQALRAHGETQFIIYETDAVRFIVGDAPPITLDTMDVVLRISAEWIADRLGWR